jgi:hypothetical protein
MEGKTSIIMQEWNKSDKDKANISPALLDECEQYYKELWAGEQDIYVRKLIDSISVTYAFSIYTIHRQTAAWYTHMNDGLERIGRKWSRPNLDTLPEFA